MTYYHISPRADLTELSPRVSDSALRDEDTRPCVSLCAVPAACLCLIAEDAGHDLYLYATLGEIEAENCGGMWDNTDDHYEYRIYDHVPVVLVGKINTSTDIYRRARSACAWQLGDIIDKYGAEDICL